MVSDIETIAAEIASVRNWFKGAHVSDPDAREAFNGGRGVFDVGSDVAAEAFVKKHAITSVRRDENGVISHLSHHGGHTIYLIFSASN